MKVAELDAHALSTLVFNDVDVVLSTDGHEVMDTNLMNEFDKGYSVIRDVRAGETTVRITVEQAQSMNAAGGTATIPPGAEVSDVIEVKYAAMSPDKQALYDRAYRKFFVTANSSHARGRQ